MTEEVLEILGEVGTFEFFELEGPRILVPHVLEASQTSDVVDQVKQLLITLIVVKGNNRDSIVELEAK